MKRAADARGGRRAVQGGCGAPDLWFDDLVGVEPPGIDAAEAAAARALDHFSGRAAGRAGSSARSDDGDLPRAVFISWKRSGAAVDVAFGLARGLRAALERALACARAAGCDLLARQPVKIDVVQEVIAEPGADARPLCPSLHGVAFGRAWPAAFLPEELLAHRLVDATGRFQPRRAAATLKRRAGARKGTHRGLPPIAGWLRFETASFMIEAGAIRRLYRGHRRIDELRAPMLLDAAAEAGRYLTRVTGRDGKFVYSYRAETGETAAKYNMLRHAGTIYAMLELFEETRDPGIMAAAERALPFMLRKVRPCPTAPGRAVCLVERGYTKLGGNALAALALTAYIRLTGRSEHEPTLRGLIAWVLHTQSSEGAFRIHKQSYPDGRLEPFVSEYYPGEAILALARGHALLHEPSWLRAACRGADFLITERDAGLGPERLAHDHWLLYGLADLDRLAPAPRYREHVLRLVHAILGAQHGPAAPPDWRGGFYDPPRSTPTATRMEGLAAVHSLCQEVDPALGSRVRNALEAGIGFCLQTQFSPESAMYLSRPEAALGGFRRSLTEFEVRIDYVQHNISALLGLHRILDGALAGEGAEGEARAA